MLYRNKNMFCRNLKNIEPFFMSALNSFNIHKEEIVNWEIDGNKSVVIGWLWEVTNGVCENIIKKRIIFTNVHT